jgi:(4S)-4-hydroxy-5-phosphonooxypentane-2,3-dione isomerase
MKPATCAVCVTFHIRAEFFDEFLIAVRQQARNSLEKEPWCHQFDVSTQPDQPHSVLLYETYDDREAFFEKHRHTEHFAQFTQKITPWVESKQVGVWDILP